MTSARYTADPGCPQPLDPLSVRQEHCLEPGARGDLLLVDVVPQKFLVLLAVAEVPETIIDYGVPVLARDIAVDQPEVTVCREEVKVFKSVTCASAFQKRYQAALHIPQVL